MQLAIDDDISLPCIAFTDIDDNGVVNIMIGSSSGTIRAIRVPPPSSLHFRSTKSLTPSNHSSESDA